MANFKAIVTSIFLFVAMVYAIEPLMESVIYQDGTLVVSTFQLPWADAQNYCKNINRTLLSVNSPDKDRLLVNLFVNGASGNVTMMGNSWISAKEKSEGVWNWDSNEEPLYYTRWFVGQPDDTGDLNCVYQAKTALLYWRDANCSAPMYFICE